MSPAGSPDAAGILRNLAATCREGERRFRAAAEGVDDPTLKWLFQTYSEQRAGFARELRQELASIGGGDESHEAVGGRGLEGCGSPGTIGGADEAAIVAEREQGEQNALAAYGLAVRGRLPSSAGKTVERQYLQLMDAYKHVRSLERSLAGLP